MKEYGVLVWSNENALVMCSGVPVWHGKATYCPWINTYEVANLIPLARLARESSLNWLQHVSGSLTN